jgi:hypothetical protein
MTTPSERRERFEEKFPKGVLGSAIQGSREDLLSFLESEVKLAEEGERERILDLANIVAHDCAKQYEDEKWWKQPYAGNRVIGFAFELRKVASQSNKKIK